nr:immunoglobulin heavy chain junction region [Mus musculus]
CARVLYYDYAMDYW